MLFSGSVDTGTIFYTRRAKEALVFADVQAAIRRFERCDWGEAPSRFKTRNQEGVIHLGEVVGMYRDRNGTGFWVINEAGHQATLVKLGDEWS